jgi:hypothetical protein
MNLPEKRGGIPGCNNSLSYLVKNQEDILMFVDKINANYCWSRPNYLPGGIPSWMDPPLEE